MSSTTLKLRTPIIQKKMNKKASNWETCICNNKDQHSDSTENYT